MNQFPLQECPQIFMAGIGSHARNTEGHYSFPDYWCLHLYTYRGHLTVDDQAFTISPGCFSLLPPGTQHHYRFADYDCRHAHAIFHAPNAKGADTFTPMVHPLGTRFASCFHALESAIRYRATQPERANVRLFDLLFTIAAHSAPETAGYTYRLTRPLLEWIDIHLAERFKVDRICQEFGISHNYLNRIFNQDMHCTIAAYIHQRRADWACQLLRDTTIPVKAIAAELGYMDLAQFSTFIKRHVGQAPRALRRDAQMSPTYTSARSSR